MGGHRDLLPHVHLRAPLRAFVLVLAIGAPAIAMGPTPARADAHAAPVSSPLVAEAVREYTTMRATRYQHHNVENTRRRTYFYDCVGFVTYALQQSRPTAHSTLMTRLAIRRGYVPSPALYVRFFDQLDGTQPGWSAIARVSDLQPGDVVAWAYDNPSHSNGHAFVVGSAPTPDGTDSWLVTVWDSTASPHGRDDTRRTNPKNLPGPNGKPSGLGRGVVRLDADGTGRLTAVHWSSTSGPVAAARYGMGRPTVG